MYTLNVLLLLQLIRSKKKAVLLCSSLLFFCFDIVNSPSQGVGPAGLDVSISTVYSIIFLQPVFYSD